MPKLPDLLNHNTMSPDPFFLADPLGASRIPDPCPPACPGTRPGGFCGLRIEPDCLRIGNDSTARVGLAATPDAWFKFLADLGQLLSLTYNPVATLAILGAGPTVEDWSDPVLPMTSTALAAPNLAEHARLWAFRAQTLAGPSHGLEIEDATGTRFQRLCLTGATNHERFEEFVLQHQTPPEQAGVWHSPNNASSARRRSVLASRVPWLRQRLAVHCPYVRPLQKNAVIQLLGAATRASFPVRTMLYAPAIIQGSVWTPEAAVASPRHGDRGARTFASERTVLQIDPVGIGSAWLWTGPCSCCGETRWSIEVGDHTDGIGLAVLSGNQSLEMEWRELVRRVAP